MDQNWHFIWEENIHLKRLHRTLKYHFFHDQRDFERVADQIGFFVLVILQRLGTSSVLIVKLPLWIIIYKRAHSLLFLDFLMDGWIKVLCAFLCEAWEISTANMFANGRAPICSLWLFNWLLPHCCNECAVCSQLLLCAVVLMHLSSVLTGGLKGKWLETMTN